MTKMIGIVTVIAAFVVALLLVLSRRTRIARLSPAGRPASRFALLVTSFVALLTGAQRPALGDKPKTGATPPQSTEAERTREEKALADLSKKLRPRAEWRKIKEAWLAVLKLSGNYDGMGKIIAEKKEACRKLLEPLVAAKIVSRDGASTFNAVYADRLFHQLRAHSGATCYDPTDLGWKQQILREDLEKRLVLLQGLRAKGTLKGEVLQKLEWTLKKQMEVVLRLEALWAKQPKDGKWDKFRKAEDEIRALLGKHDYKAHTLEIKDTLQVRAGIEEALRIIRLIYAE
jgi:hypothetical protein